MSGLTDTNSYEGYIQELSKTTELLMEKIEEGNAGDIAELIDSIKETRDRGLFTEIGKLTRALHDAISEFHIDSYLDDSDQKEVSTISDATDRLSYVMNLTDAAANRTMDMVEASLPIAQGIGDDTSKLKRDWERLGKREISYEEFGALYKDMGKFLEANEKRVTDLQQNLTNILVAQDYQDLTGQVIKRVVSLVQDVEGSLVNLVKLASNVEAVSGIESDKGDKNSKPAQEEMGIFPTKNEEFVSGQDDVDDLLSSLGF
ncbi:MAG: protein phosphatase CheZ [Pseudomonadales bacterium]|nr:protein phosphatase CheZ [Pseudomonadales bacterium]